jgi:energy-coupling factor transport system ATP-binding protein
MLEIKNASVVYDSKTIFKKEALTDVSLEIGYGESISIVGKIGSGKSTLIKLFNGLIKPDEGHVILDGYDINEGQISRKEIIKKVGIVFQYPEEQFFAETVFDEVAFGPRNLKFTETQVKESVLNSLQAMGFNPSEIITRPPFHISGGEKRRIAIASIIAMNPAIIVLDEPTAGMDYEGKISIMSQIRKQSEKGMSTVFVTHDMEEAFYLSERLIALNNGLIVFDGPSKNFFLDKSLVNEIGLEIPFTINFREKLLKCFPDVPLSSDLDAIIEFISARLSN